MLRPSTRDRRPLAQFPMFPFRYCDRSLVLRSSQMIHLIFETPEVGGGIGPVGVES